MTLFNIDNARALKFKDVAHFFLGCKIRVFHPNQPPRDSTLTPAFLGDPAGAKPLLLPMSKMTEEQKKGLSRIMNIHHSRNLLPTIPCNRNLNYWINVNNPFEMLYLCSCGLDVFGLIESKEAIDITAEQG